MQMMKKETGITMIILAITIVILGIVSAIIISYSVVGTRETKDKKLLTNLQTVQHAVYERGEQYKVSNDTSLLIGSPMSARPVTGFTWEDNNAYWSKSTAYERYYKLGQSELKELGIDNADETNYIVNYKTQEVYDVTHKTTSTGKELYNKNK